MRFPRVPYRIGVSCCFSQGSVSQGQLPSGLLNAVASTSSFAEGVHFEKSGVSKATQLRMPAVDDGASHSGSASDQH